MKPASEEFLLGDEWLGEYITQLDKENLSDRQIATQVNRWVLAVVKYTFWLRDEGFDDGKAIERAVNRALDAANFDVRRFPVVP
jgi:hypothetical protein